ncbi:MAG: transposase, partial [Okeania sp. SIO3B3]|nr:transposase [Okeania sp. SIO3B3]
MTLVKRYNIPLQTPGVHQNLGGSKHFKCPHCGHSMPRDWNGALGIFLKALRDTACVDGSAVTLL